MHDMCNKPKHKNGHVNTFVDLNGIPYIYEEYLDRTNIRQIDRSMVRSEIVTDTHEAMRKVLNISLNDIGNTQDGYLRTKGNNQKTHELLEMIRANAPRLDHLLDVMKSGLIVRVNYQLEDASNGYVISTYRDEFRITRRQYYLDINSRNVNDNAIVTLFNDSMVTCINEFVHGHRHLNLRVTNIEMYYEMMSRCPKNVGDNHFYRYAAEGVLPTHYGMELDYYKFHKNLQPQHILCPTCYENKGIYNHNDPHDILPPTWMNFNRFYHFDEDSRSIILHHEEIHDPHCEVIKVPCGKIIVNRLMGVHPGTRVVYNFMIWKNDLTIINDAMPIARVLQAPMGGYWDRPHHDHDCNPDYEHDLDKEHILHMLHENQEMNARQNRIINDLNKQVQDLKDMLSNPPKDCDCGCIPSEEPELEDVGATVDGVEFETVQEAIDAVELGKVSGEIILQSDVEEELIITGEITINLNGHTIQSPDRIDTANFHHTILVDGGKLTINGDGNVINNNSQGYCVMNAGYEDTWVPDGRKSMSMGEGTVILNGGRYYRGGNDDQHRGYVLVNHGAMMTINDGVEVDVIRDDSSLVTNGYMGTPQSCPVMIINGGKFRGGRHTINNDHGGRLIINDGKFEMGTPWPDVEDFATGPKNVLRNEDQGVARIAGGEFIGNVENSNTMKDALLISGGKFSVSVAEWLDPDYKQEPNGKVVNRD